MKDKFVKLTYSILSLEGLNSTDKIILARRLGWGKTPYFEKTSTLATALNMPLKTVQKSITKLKMLGHWPDKISPARGDLAPSRGGSTPPRGGNTSTRGGGAPPRGDDNKAVSPMKTESLLDSILDIKLDNNKIVTLDSSANASQHCKVTQTFFKKLDKINSDSIITKSGLVEVSDEEDFNRVVEKGTEPAAAPPLDDGVHLTRQEMLDANFTAYFESKPQPYTATQVARGRVLSADEQVQAEVAKVFGELVPTYSNEKGLQKAV
jgi:hypothetical protein